MQDSKEAETTGSLDQITALKKLLVFEDKTLLSSADAGGHKCEMASLDCTLLRPAWRGRGNEQRCWRLLFGMQLIGVTLALAFFTGVSSEVPYTDARIGETLIVPQVATENWGAKLGESVPSLRLRIPGLSRLKFWQKLAATVHVNVRLGSPGTRAKVEVCLHGNGSLPLLHCTKETWRPVDKNDGWTDVMSPFETVFLDIKAAGPLSASSLNVTVYAETKGYRAALLAAGLSLFAVAPLVSGWVPFYYSSGITLGILLVLLVLLFQVMKLLPTSRRSTLYVAVYGTVAGLGTIVINYIVRGAAAFLHRLGYGDDLVNPLVYLVLAVIVLLGAALGFFSVRKFILSAEGEVDEGTAKFVLWALRVFGAVMVAQSTLDPIIALLLVLLGAAISFGVGNISFLFSVAGQGLSSLQLPPWPETIIPRDIPYFSPIKQDGAVKHSPVRILKDLPVNQGQKKQSTTEAAEPWNRPGHTPLFRRQANTPEPRFGRLSATTDTARPLRSPVEERPTVSPLLRSPLTPLYRRPSSSPFGGNSSRSPSSAGISKSPLSSSPLSPYRSPPAVFPPEPGFYSTFHNLPEQKPISIEDYKQMSVDCTRTAVGDLMKSEEFQTWSLQHADRLRTIPNEHRHERSSADIQRTADMEGYGDGVSRGLLTRILRR